MLVKSQRGNIIFDITNGVLISSYTAIIFESYATQVTVGMYSDVDRTEEVMRDIFRAFKEDFTNVYEMPEE